MFNYSAVSLLVFTSILNLVGLNARASDLDYFPKDYEASKARFLNYSNQAKAKYQKVEQGQILVGAEQLSIDTLFIPAQGSPESLVILTSGNHGPEGYAGSALQALFFDEVLGTLNLEHTGVLLVHAMNPWGFKHHRRGTENNVNLNRNFDLSTQLFSTKNSEYDRLKDLMELQGEVSCAAAFPAKDLILEMLLKKGVTQQSLTEAIGKGQYSSAKGINFGGQGFESQTLDMIELLKKVVKPYHAIFHIDLHTGLGKKNVLHVMTKYGLNEVSTQKQKTLFDASKDQDQYELTPPDAEGFYEINGDYANIIGKLYPEKDRVIIPITAEFGTVGNGLLGKTITINRLILENEGYFYGYGSEKVETKVKDRFLELFYPSNLKWRAGVIEKGRYFLTVVLKRFLEQNQGAASAK